MISASELIEQAFKIYRGKFKFFLRSVVWLIMLVAIPQALVEAFFATAPLPFRVTAITLTTILLQLYLTVLLIVVSDKGITSEKPALKPLFLHALRRTPHALLVYVVMGIVTFIALIPFWIIGFIAVGGVKMAPGAAIPVTNIALLLGSLATVWIAFSLPDTIIQKTDVSAALRQSVKMVRGRYWRTLWRILAPLLFFGVAVSLISSVIGLVASRIHPQAHFYTDALIGAAAAPLFVLALILLYHDLKRV